MLGTGVGFHPIQEADTVYVITDDYFASFRAVFGPKKCELHGKAHSLRHFAVKALEMDGSFLRRLREAVAQFKPELEVFSRPVPHPARRRPSRGQTRSGNG